MEQARADEVLQALRSKSAEWVREDNVQERLEDQLFGGSLLNQQMSNDLSDNKE
jgi:hypothetical protein